MSKPTSARPHGQIRQSQLLTTFGPGSMLDLPNHSVLIGGLDHWLQKGEEIPEPRLVEKLQRMLELPDLKLYAPPPGNEDPTTPRTGITAWQFPEWFITQDVDEGSPVRSRLLVLRSALTKGRFIDRDRRRRPVVPVRFVRACRKGHIGDIDWYAFVHGGSTACRPQQRQLFIDERGTTGDLSEVWVRCECKAERPMSDAARMQTKALGNCDGARP